jgi:ATP-dependent RNA helicase DDX10/DBP4
VHLQKDKDVFQLTELPADEFAASLGLPGAPKIKFLSRERAKEKKNAAHVTADDEESEDGGDEHASSEEDETEAAAAEMPTKV